MPACGRIVLPHVRAAPTDGCRDTSSLAKLAHSGFVATTLIRMYWTEVRGAELMGSKARPFAFGDSKAPDTQGAS
jgi:hypothetical protein